VRLEVVPDPSLPRGGPGRDGYGHLRVTGIQVEAAPVPAANRDPQAPRAVQFATIKVDDSASPFEPGDLLGTKPGGYARQSGSWAFNAMRDTERLPRHAVLAAAEPFGFPEGTRITVRIDHLEGTIGQGIGRFRVSVTNQSSPLEGGSRATAAKSVRAAGRRAQPRISRRARRRVRRRHRC
jgi:hypothetical protein